jgi:hypothetical protein
MRSALVAASCSILLLVVPESISTAGVAGHPTWTVRAVPRGIGVLNDVVCPSASHCYAGGESGTGPGSIIGSSDGGDHWQLLKTTPEGSQLSAIVCPTPSRCLVAGQINPPDATEQPTVEVNAPAPTPPALEAFLTTDDGARWTAETLPNAIFGVEGAACASVKVCLVAGSAGIARTTNGGTTWVMENIPSRFFQIGPVACPTRSFCIVGGDGGSSSSVASVSKNAGATWSRAIIVAGPVHPTKDSLASTALEALSCSGPQHCLGLITDDSLSSFGTGSPIVTFDAGMTWGRASERVGASDSCVGNFCASVGGHVRPLAGGAFVSKADAFISTDGGANWKSSSLPTHLIPTAVSCTSSTHCVAVGGDFPKATSALILTYS